MRSIRSSIGGETCEQPKSTCDDALDNDADAKIDCDDLDCFATPSCDGSKSEVCDDKIDNDGDRLVDCQDPECIGETGPSGESCEQPEATCDDGFDNDVDNKIDCHDADCIGGPACTAQPVG